MSVDELLRWLVLLPLIPAVGSGLWLAFRGREVPAVVAWLVHCGAPLVSFALAVVATTLLATEFAPDERVLVDNVYTWLSAGDFHAELGLRLDPLASVMLLAISGVGAFVHIYAVGWIKENGGPGLQRVLAWMNGLLAAATLAVLADNLLSLLLGWQLLSLCAFGLMALRSDDASSADRAHRALAIGRTADVGFLLAVLLLFWAYADAGTPSVDIAEMAAGVEALRVQQLGLPVGDAQLSLLGLAGLALLVAAAARAAQPPLHTWVSGELGPIPASALLQSTGVAIGVYVMLRMSFALTEPLRLLLIWGGTASALLAGFLALAQRDARQVLRFSTVGQVGLALVALGVHAYGAAAFQLIAHAAFKALAVLGLGSVILALRGETRVERMGGLRHRLPWTHASLAVGLALLAAFPALFTLPALYPLGDWAAPGVLTSGLVIALALFGASMARLYILLFEGRCRAPLTVQREIRERGAPLLFSTVTLAGMAALLPLVGLPDPAGESLLGIEQSNSLRHFLEPALGSTVRPPRGDIAALGALATALGIAVTGYLYRRRLRELRRLGTRVAFVERLLARRLSAWERLVVGPMRWAAGALSTTLEERWIRQGAIEGTASVVQRSAVYGLRRLQNGYAQSYLLVMLLGAFALLAWVI